VISHKLGIINRFHRTLKNELTKYFSSHDTVKWIDVIDNIINNYNHTVNRGIGVEPFKANSFIENQIIQKAEEKTIKIKSEKDVINIGSLVRTKLLKTVFIHKLQSE
jgi:hypothetical protein